MSYDEQDFDEDYSGDDDSNYDQDEFEGLDDRYGENSGRHKISSTVYDVVVILRKADWTRDTRGR